MKRKFTFGQVVIYCILGLVFIVTAYPFFQTLSLAVMPYKQYLQKPIHALPSGFTLTYFEEILRDSRIVRAFAISILKTGIGTALGVVVTMMTGYVLSRRELKYGRFLSLLFLGPMFLYAGVIPYYLVMHATGLLNTFWVLILPLLARPFYVFMVKAFLAEYPKELLDAATIDGVGQFGLFWRIVWPTSKPIIATMTMLYGTFHWNEYFWPSLLVRAKLHTATVVLQNLVTMRNIATATGITEELTPESFTAAVAAMLIIPVLVVYPFVQRYVVKGLMVGAVKG